MQLNAVSKKNRNQATTDMANSTPIPTCTSAVLFASVRSRCSHDLSWGTKGSDAAQAVDLGAVHGVGRHVEVELVSAQQDIDIAYQDALDNIRLKRAKVGDEEMPPKKDVTEQKQKDVYVRVRLFPAQLESLPLGQFPYQCKSPWLPRCLRIDRSCFSCGRSPMRCSRAQS
jgi:hypothetical protein